LLDGFPNAPDALTLSGEMGDLFHRVFNEGLADEMPPLKALSLFYEFRDLTPLGEKGDQIIQRLADRLAAIDLLDRATQLLEHQIKFRVTAEQRSQVGARLALLHLLNSHPQEALNVLEVTNYGNNSPDLNTQRHQLTAEALTRLGKNEEALGVLYNDTTPVGARLRLDVLWAMQDWPNVVNHAEEILSTRTNLTEPLTLDETEVLLKLALGYSFEGDYVQLRYLRDYYGELIPNTAYKQIFDFITNDTTPLDPEDFAMLAKQISRTENFLSTFKAKIAAGKLSETIQ
jgi:type II secretory pathway component PulJ